MFHYTRPMCGKTPHVVKYHTFTQLKSIEEIIAIEIKEILSFSRRREYDSDYSTMTLLKLTIFFNGHITLTPGKSITQLYGVYKTLGTIRELIMNRFASIAPMFLIPIFTELIQAFKTTLTFNFINPTRIKSSPGFIDTLNLNLITFENDNFVMEISTEYISNTL